MSLDFAIPVNKLTLSYLSLGGFGKLYYIMANSIVIYSLRDNNSTILKCAAYEKVLKFKSKPVSRTPCPPETSGFLVSTSTDRTI
jgi:hypothetical protein